MTCRFRAAKPGDLEFLSKNSTENGKFDEESARQSDEIRVMECDGVPIMAIGAIRYPQEDLTDTLGIWGVFSKDIKGHTREAVQFCHDLMFTRAATRYVALIDERNPVFKRFVEFFGFQRTKVVEEKDGTVYHVYVKEN